MIEWVSGILCRLNGRRYIKKARIIAEHYHARQQRDDGKPYIEHLKNVQWLLHLAGAPEWVQAAGILHDILEDTEMSEEQLAVEFGWRITDLVRQVSKPYSIKCPEAWLIKICDVLDNCTDTAPWPEGRKLVYFNKKRKFFELR